MKPRTLVVIDQVAVEPVTLSEAKRQVGILDEQSEHDSLLSAAALAGRRLIEQRLGVALVQKQLRARWDAGTEVLSLPYTPLLSGQGLSVQIGDALPLAAASYELDEDARPVTVRLLVPATEDPMAEYWVGPDSPDEVDPLIKSALLMFVEHQFSHRGIMTNTGFQELPQGFEMMLAASSVSGAY